MKSKDGRFVYLGYAGEELPSGTPAKDVHRFGYACRATPGEFCVLNLRGRGHDIAQRSWEWDGNVDAPTLKPSINCKECWHGFIEGGVFLNTNRRPEGAQ